MQRSAAQKSALTDSVKWAALVAGDGGYDGLFFYGVTTTGIFCRPSCRAKQPLRANVVFFGGVEDAVQAGFRPCKKCRPDVADYDPAREKVARVKELYGGSFDDPHGLKGLIAHTGIGSNQLLRLFRRYEGCTPGQYLAGLRIEKAQRLLNDSGMNILQISLECGYESLSNFYKRFRDQTGLTPAQYRRRGGVCR